MGIKKRVETNKIIIHCAATSPSMDIGAQEIERWHRQRGFQCIGYHFVIRRDGSLEYGRAVDEVGAHVSGHNHDSIGICLVGGVKESDKKTPERNFTPAQYDKLKWLVADLKTFYPDAKVYGHNEFAQKACPCFDVREIFPDR